MMCAAYFGVLSEKRKLNIFKRRSDEIGGVLITHLFRYSYTTECF